MIAYHVTGRPLAGKILAEGLRTDALGYDTGYVWLFDDLGLARDAIDACETWGGYYADDLVILVIDADGLDIIADPHPGWGDPAIDDHSFAYAGNIPADRVRESITICHLPAP